MKAGNAYRLLHRSGGRAPSRGAAPERFDQIEIVDIALGETVLLWDLPSREGRSQSSTVSPSAMSTTSIWSKRAGSAKRLGMRPPRRCSSR